MIHTTRFMYSESTAQFLFHKAALGITTKNEWTYEQMLQRASVRLASSHSLGVGNRQNTREEILYRQEMGDP